MTISRKQHKGRLSRRRSLRFETCESRLVLTTLYSIDAGFLPTSETTPFATIAGSSIIAFDDHAVDAYAWSGIDTDSSLRLQVVYDFLTNSNGITAGLGQQVVEPPPPPVGPAEGWITLLPEGPHQPRPVERVPAAIGLPPHGNAHVVDDVVARDRGDAIDDPRASAVLLELSSVNREATTEYGEQLVALDLTKTPQREFPAHEPGVTAEQVAEAKAQAVNQVAERPEYSTTDSPRLALAEDSQRLGPQNMTRTLLHDSEPSDSQGRAVAADAHDEALAAWVDAKGPLVLEKRDRSYGATIVSAGLVALLAADSVHMARRRQSTDANRQVASIFPEDA